MNRMESKEQATLEEMHDAATKVQSSFRGRQDRLKILDFEIQKARAARDALKEIVDDLTVKATKREANTLSATE